MGEGRGQHGGHSKKHGFKKGFVEKFFSVSKIFSSSFQSSTISKASISCQGAPPCRPALLEKASSSASYRRSLTEDVVVLDLYVPSDGTLLRGSRTAPSEDETEEESQQHEEEDTWKRDFDAHECLGSDSADRPVTPKATAFHIRRRNMLAQTCGKDTKDVREPCGPGSVVQPPVHAAGAVASQVSPGASESSPQSVLAAKVTSLPIDEKQDVLPREQEGCGGVPRASDVELALPQLGCCAGQSASLCVSSSVGRAGTEAVVAEVVTKLEGRCQEQQPAEPQQHHAPSSAPSSPICAAADAAATTGPTAEDSRGLPPTAMCPLPPRQRKKLRPVLVPRAVSESSVVEGEEDVRAWFAPSPNCPPLPPGAYMRMQSGRWKSGAEEPPNAWLEEYWSTSSR